MKSKPTIAIGNVAKIAKPKSNEMIVIKIVAIIDNVLRKAWRVEIAATMPRIK